MFLDFAVGAFLNIQHPVSSIEHLPGICNHHVLYCKPVGKISYNIGIKIA